MTSFMDFMWPLDGLHGERRALASHIAGGQPGVAMYTLELRLHCGSMGFEPGRLECLHISLDMLHKALML